jgi:hypothetical protein
MRAVLGLFFVQRLHMTERVASEAMALFVVACYVSPLLGAYLSDALWGRYTTITRLSGVYFMGSCLLAAAAASTSAGGVFTALSLVALGTGGIKPCVSVSCAQELQLKEEFECVQFLCLLAIANSWCFDCFSYYQQRGLCILHSTFVLMKYLPIFPFFTILHRRLAATKLTLLSLLLYSASFLSFTRPSMQAPCCRPWPLL